MLVVRLYYASIALLAGQYRATWRLFLLEIKDLGGLNFIGGIERF